MKAALLVFALVVVAGLVECRDLNLHGKLAEVRRNLKRARGGGKGEEKSGGDDERFPAEWMAFATLVGKCESAYYFFELIGWHPDEGILSEACPIACKVGGHLNNADEEHVERASKLVAKGSELIQCSNLQAEREGVQFWMYIYYNETDQGIPTDDDSIFLTEAKPLFDGCQVLFDSVADENHELRVELEALDDAVTDDSTRELANLLRSLIHVNKRK